MQLNICSFSKPNVLKYGPCTTHHKNVLYTNPEVIKIYGSTVRLECEERKVKRTLQKYSIYITMQKNHRRNSSKAPAILNLHGTVDFSTVNLVFIDGELGSKNK